MNNSKVKISVTYFWVITLSIFALGFIYIAISIDSVSGILLFDEHNKQEYILKNDSDKSNKLTFTLNASKDNDSSGVIEVKILDEKNNTIFQEVVQPGEQLDFDHIFSRGGEGIILIDGTRYTGKVSYSKKVIHFF